MVFVDGQFRGLGKVALGDLIPGTHYVLVQVPGTGGLQYVRTVQTNEPSRLDVDWSLETMVHIEDPWAGLIFPTEAERAKEALYAGELARRLRRDDLIIIGLAQLNGVSYVVGTQYPANGDPPIGAFAPVSGGEALLRSLARYLYDGTMAAGLRVLPRSSAGVSPAIALRDSEQRSPSTLLPKVVAGAGVLTVAAGAIAYKVSKGYDPMHPSGDKDGKNPTVFAMLGGSAVLGGGTYLWLRESTSASRLSAGLLSIGTAGIVAGAVLYLADTKSRSARTKVHSGYCPCGRGDRCVGSCPDRARGFPSLSRTTRKQHRDRQASRRPIVDSNVRARAIRGDHELRGPLLVRFSAGYYWPCSRRRWR